MIVKILSSASNDFHGVKYNDKKMENGAGELMTMENFPEGFDENTKQEDVRNYFKSISKSDKVKKPQFHATISTKFQNHSKEYALASLFVEKEKLLPNLPPANPCDCIPGPSPNAFIAEL